MNHFFSRLHIRESLLLIILGALSIVSIKCFTEAGYWFLLAVLSAAALTREKTLVDQMRSLGIVAIAGSVIVVLAGWTQLVSPVNVIFLISITWICSFFSYYHDSHRQWLVWINFFAIVAALQIIPSGMHDYRAMMLFLGYIFYAVLLFDFPTHASQRKTQLTRQAVLYSLRQLTNDIFSCFSEIYKDNTYLFERRLHEQKTNYMRVIEKFSRSLTPPFFVESANTIFENLIDCSQLRWRVKDASTFELCDREMRAILIGLNKLFDVLIKMNAHHTIYPIVSIDRQIESLESNYQSILLLAASDPFVFQLFIESIKRLQESIDVFYNQHKDI